MTMKRSYSPNMPSDVREFAQEIARLTTSGPVGAEQAARMIAESKLTEEGRLLVTNARRQARISAEIFGLNFGNIKIYSDDNPNQLQRDLQIQALSAKPIASSSSGDVSPSTTARDLVTHELTYVVQQAASRGLK
ncbi:MAG: DUF4157 domain-containing protein [Candidatus Zixiibacteriota bacterium]|nr:MAG: DUF4157 domain-containing protein [candidate division Zixibacteria bacterium]